MLPWMCGRQTLTIVVPSPCMTQAQMIVAVVAARLAAGGAPSPLTPPAFAAGRYPKIVVQVYRLVRPLVTQAAEAVNLTRPSSRPQSVDRLHRARVTGSSPVMTTSTGAYSAAMAAG